MTKSIQAMATIEGLDYSVHDARLDAMYNQMVNSMAKEIDDMIMSSITSSVKPKTDEERVISILKGQFESEFGMTFDRFIETYEQMKVECPEKLI